MVEVEHPNAKENTDKSKFHRVRYVAEGKEYRVKFRLCGDKIAVHTVFQQLEPKPNWIFNAGEVIGHVLSEKLREIADEMDAFQTFLKDPSMKKCQSTKWCKNCSMSTICTEGIENNGVK